MSADLPELPRPKDNVEWEYIPGRGHVPVDRTETHELWVGGRIIGWLDYKGRFTPRVTTEDEALEETNQWYVLYNNRRAYLRDVYGIFRYGVHFEHDIGWFRELLAEVPELPTYSGWRAEREERLSRNSFDDYTEYLRHLLSMPLPIITWDDVVERVIHVRPEID